MGGPAYLVGGYTGSRYATAVLRFRPGRPPAVVTRLPAGLRYAGVAALGDTIYVARDKDVLAVNTADGSARTIPFSWRRTLPKQYLPEPEDPESPTHLEVSGLTLTPDGRTLVLTEWLNGDAAG